MFKGTVHRGGESEQQEPSAAGHSVLTVRSRRWGMHVLSSISSFHSSQDSAQGTVPSTVVRSPQLIWSSQQCPPAACPEIVFQGILNPNKLTVVLAVAVIWAHSLGLSSVGPKAQSSHGKDTCSEQRRRREKEQD